MVRTIKYSSANLKYACYNPFPDVLLHDMDISGAHFKLFPNLCLISKILNGLGRPPPPLSRFCLSLKHSAFSIQATKQWNTLRDDGRKCSYISTFKSILGALLKMAQPCIHWSLLPWFPWLDSTWRAYLLYLCGALNCAFVCSFSQFWHASVLITGVN